MSCYGSDDIWVVDPELRAGEGLASHVSTTARVFGSVKTMTAVGLKLYAGLFNHHKIAIIPLEPGADGRHTVVGEIQ